MITRRTWLRAAASGAVLAPLPALAGPAVPDPVGLPKLRPEAVRAARGAFERHGDKFRNRRYSVIIDFSQPSGARRFLLLDLEGGKEEYLLVAHGEGSDPDNDGVATHFSNTEGSLMSSLGTYATMGTYYGRHGLSLKLQGLDPTNDAAEARAIVVHGADYVSPKRSVLGRSWGCPALEYAVSASVIERIKDGAMIHAYHSGADTEV